MALPSEECFVFAISDADLQRYGIAPAALGDALTAQPPAWAESKNGASRSGLVLPRMNAYVLFISNNFEEASRIRDEVAPGHAFVCIDTAALAAILRMLFSMLTTAP